MLSNLKSLENIANRPVIAYTAIALLQLKAIWRIWDYKDLANGDTSSYFLTAYTWSKYAVSDIVWSPLYTSFYGFFLNISSDVYAATILHRIAIVFTATLLVLAVLRRLLPHSVAWLIAAWWAILPINFDTLYEVHLFSVIPTLVACLIVLSSTAPWARGVAVAIMAAATVLVRNELSLATAAFGCMCLAWEIWQYRTAEQKRPILTYALSYAIPLVLALSLIIFFYVHSIIKFPELSTYAAPKHTLNVCQVYAFGYQQRYSDWVGSPWTECQSLMKRQFGQEQPTLFQAFRANPSAIIEHFLWNSSLTLNGIQVSLFNATSGNVNPDYAPVTLNARWVILPTLLVGMASITGLVLIYRDRRYWWQFWLKDKALGWLLLFCVAAVGFFVVIPMQRPRPSYLFALSFFLMAILGMSLFVIAQRWKRLQRIPAVLSLCMIALILFLPSYYTNVSAERRLLSFYRFFTPFQETISQPNTVFLTREFSSELCSFLRDEDVCQPLSYSDEAFFSSMPADTPIEDFLNQREVDLFYADKNFIAKFSGDSRVEKLLKNPQEVGWRLLSIQNSDAFGGMLFERLSDSTVSFLSDVRNNKFKHTGIYQDGWIGRKSSFDLPQYVQTSKLVISGTIPAYKNPNFKPRLRVKVDGKEIVSQEYPAGDFNLELEVPEQQKQTGLRSISLYFSKAQSLPTPDRRRVSAKLTFIGFKENG
ncbi:MAG TPA: hypothetical protein V6C84_22845 [Coleofasciculaceae cyanobacterium]|jgi:hypothetical protein